ncbi:response regulator transcription factor [Conexibacter sp. JD483]|uniref:response regulator n=1 Tax=unclassified Conexibacter TaxID=2627773 RepID=UPI00271927FB|nr:MULTISPECIES: response regulator transcription factor [unclassified Conexibacter]MDO8187783.1 response regulator transcription factor [Conexibacter sp. CPCC 205706]MDO8201971.1 response regulator transcription factor [Conexibacter sp. CPCC 205762]MDR9372565.1 response regulator transcription factor [Conexibacter sp. JD483]
MIRIALIDDHELLRTGIRAILEAQPDIEVVGEASDGAAGVELVLRTHPDVVLMDIRMPKLDGIEATRRLVAAGSRARLIVVTTFDHDEYVVEALRAGAAAFLLKDAPPERLAAAVRTVAAGDRLLAPAITERLVARHLAVSDHEHELRARFDELTARELELVRLLARGLSNRDIAGELHLSEATVKTHVTRILRKLELVSRVQAVVLAYECGLVRPRGGGGGEVDTS